ncbi:MAG: hypothetical protein M1834_002687 [Cirrosporium novae-zelandiae]|nr:MAG: hypothetical protein M1834_002687 [Cirrosporium novae-zelandiae]
MARSEIDTSTRDLCRGNHRPRRAGLTKNKGSYQSLHPGARNPRQNGKQRLQSSSSNESGIYASPKSISSSDSEDSNSHDTLRTTFKPPAPLPAPTSNITPSKFKRPREIKETSKEEKPSRKSTRLANGQKHEETSQSSHKSSKDERNRHSSKRSREDLEDDENIFRRDTFGTKKQKKRHPKPKTTYGRNRYSMSMAPRENRSPWGGREREIPPESDAIIGGFLHNQRNNIENTALREWKKKQEAREKEEVKSFDDPVIKYQLFPDNDKEDPSSSEPSSKRKENDARLNFVKPPTIKQDPREPKFKNPVTSVSSSIPSSFATTSAESLFDSQPPPSSTTSLNSDLSNHNSSEFDLSDEERRLEFGDISTQLPSQPCCPICNVEVDEEHLRNFNIDRYSSVKNQSLFHKSHLQSEARQNWTKKGYPEIRWEDFEKRLKRFLPQVKELVDLKRDSFYRKAIESKPRARTRRAKELMAEKGSNIFTPGYYGSRGKALMCDLLITTFSSNLQTAQSEDSLLKSLSVPIYVQEVLVPELTIILVKDDMNVDDEQARNILNESSELGDLLNAEVDDIVTGGVDGGVEIEEML